MPDEVWDVVDKELEGKIGTGYSDTIRNIVLYWFGEHGYPDKGGKHAKEK